MWIRELRLRYKLTQEDLSNKLVLAGYNITPGTISHWENGRYSPPMEQANFRTALAKSFRISEAELLKCAGYEIEPTEHSIEGERAASLIDRMPKSRRAMAIDILERMVEG